MPGITRHHPPVFGGKKRPSEKSYLEARVQAFLESRGLPLAARGWRFHPTRKWHFDFAWLDRGLALEIEGAIFVKGGHSSGVGIMRDIEKYNAAHELGWWVYRASSMNFRDGSVFELVTRLASGPRPVYVREALVP